jgi:hypothetical protein
MDLQRKTGLTEDGEIAKLDSRALRRSILLKLASLGHAVPDTVDDAMPHDMRDLFARYREQSRLLSEHLNPADQRIQEFLDRELAGCGLDGQVRVPSGTLILDRYGLARELSLPFDSDAWHSEFVSSYRTDNGVLHNPINDRRTKSSACFTVPAAVPSVRHSSMPS